MIDLYITMPSSEVNKLITLTQISTNQVSNGNAKNLEDFIFKEATLVAKLNGYSIIEINIYYIYIYINRLYILIFKLLLY